MATALADAVTHEGWAEPRPVARRQLLSPAEAIWTLFGLTLLGAFLAFVSIQGA